MASSLARCASLRAPPLPRHGAHRKPEPAAICFQPRYPPGICRRSCSSLSSPCSVISGRKYQSGTPDESTIPASSARLGRRFSACCQLLSDLRPCRLGSPPADSGATGSPPPDFQPRVPRRQQAVGGGRKGCSPCRPILPWHRFGQLECDRLPPGLPSHGSWPCAWATGGLGSPRRRTRRTRVGQKSIHEQFSDSGKT